MEAFALKEPLVPHVSEAEGVFIGKHEAGIDIPLHRNGEGSDTGGADVTIVGIVHCHSRKDPLDQGIGGSGIQVLRGKDLIH